MTTKTFEERATAAMSDPRFRLSDLGKLIKSGENLFRVLQGTLDQAEADATNFRLSEADRDAAVALVEQTTRRMATVSGAGAALTQELFDRKASEKQQAIEAERNAAIKERDELAEQFRTFMPAAIAKVVELLTAIDANANRLKRAGLRDTLTAELVARGLAHFVGHSPVHLYTQMKIPSWGNAGRCWPPSDFVNPAAVGVYDPKAVKRRQAANVEKHRATWGRYRLDPSGKQNIKFVERKPHPMRAKQRNLHEEFGPVEADLDHAEADRLRKLGVNVERLEDGVSDESLIFY